MVPKALMRQRLVLGRSHSIILADRLGLGCALAATGITKSDRDALGPQTVGPWLIIPAPGGYAKVFGEALDQD
jgi:hypothetical protein